MNFSGSYYVHVDEPSYVPQYVDSPIARHRNISDLPSMVGR